MLQARDIEPTVVEYLKTPPSVAELEQALQVLGVDARGLMRDNEEVYAQLHAGDSKLSRKQLLELMHANPILIQRPVVFAQGQARIGRPPEAVLEIL